MDGKTPGNEEFFPRINLKIDMFQRGLRLGIVLKAEILKFNNRFFHLYLLLLLCCLWFCRQFIGLTVAEDIAFALENACVNQTDMKKEVLETARKVGMQRESGRSYSG